MNLTEFHCEHCGKVYKREAVFKKHYCEKMRRLDEIKTIIGQSAYMFYCDWLVNKGRIKPPVETFLASHYYKAFIRFSTKTKRVRLPDVEQFIKFVSKKNLSPPIWTSDIVYSLYIKYLDNLNPIDQVKVSLKTLRKLARHFDCDIDEAFSKLHINEIIGLIQKRKLTPWLLLHCKYFNELLIDKQTTPEQMKIIEGLIRPEYWKYKFKKYPKEVKTIQSLIKELNL